MRTPYCANNSVPLRIHRDYLGRGQGGARPHLVPRYIQYTSFKPLRINKITGFALRGPFRARKVRRMQLTLHNNRTRKKEAFVPQNPRQVTVYVCGPTVYGAAHIGNARPAVVFDVMVRLLRCLYPNVTYARNITDIDDKINARAAEENRPIREIAERYTQKYHEDMGLLGVKLPDIEPFATDHIDDIQTMIETLIAKGSAYEAEGHVLFDVSSDPSYGSLSRRKRDDMIAGARVEVAPYKKNPEDFVLWKPSSDDLPGWNSPWGRGRPGWHIECSAMIAKHFGPQIDIHAGGVDLQFPHHENECAQSRCAHGIELANYWLHNGMLNLDGEKMSKSRGNIRLIDEILEDYPGEVVRLALLQGHYRQPMDFTSTVLAQSRSLLDRLYGLLRDNAQLTAQARAAAQDRMPPEAFLTALCDDLNTPKALAALSELARDTADLDGRTAFLAAANLLGLLTASPEDWFQAGVNAVDVDQIEALIAKRATARANRDFATADAARDELEAMGVVIEDTPNGTLWRMA